MSDSLFKASSFITAICFQTPAAPLTAGAGLPGCPLPWGAHPSRARSTHLSTEQKYQRGTTKTAQDWTLEDTTALENAPTNAFLRGHTDASASGFANLCRAPELFPRQMPLSPRSLPTPELLLVDWKGPTSSAADSHFFGLGAARDSPVCNANDLPACRAAAFPGYTIGSAQTAQSCPVGSGCPHPLSWKM